MDPRERAMPTPISRFVTAVEVKQVREVEVIYAPLKLPDISVRPVADGDDLIVL